MVENTTEFCCNIENIKRSCQVVNTVYASFGIAGFLIAYYQVNNYAEEYARIHEKTTHNIYEIIRIIDSSIAMRLNLTLFLVTISCIVIFTATLSAFGAWRCNLFILKMLPSILLLFTILEIAFGSVIFANNFRVDKQHVKAINYDLDQIQDIIDLNDQAKFMWQYITKKYDCFTSSHTLETNCGYIIVRKRNNFLILGGLFSIVNAILNIGVIGLSTSMRVLGRHHRFHSSPEKDTTR